STVIFFDRSPLATAVVTSAMLRTWPVRFAAIGFTLWVSSFLVSATRGTWSWPPSLPSVPTSRATRVTSPENALSWSTIVLMVLFSSRISPFTSTVIFFDSSPFATAVVTSAMLRTSPVRFAAIRFTLSVCSVYLPPPLPRTGRDRQLRSLPGFSFLPHLVADAANLLRDHFVCFDDVVERLRDFAIDPDEVHRHANGKFPFPERAQRLQQRAAIEHCRRKLKVGHFPSHRFDTVPASPPNGGHELQPAGLRPGSAF